MTRYIKSACFAALCGVFMLAGCDNGAESLGELVVSSQPVQEEVRDDFPVNVCGAELNAAVARAVSLSPAVTEIICELGFGETLCGVSSYCDYPEGISVPAFGSTENPDTDGIRSLSPDAVFTLSALSERDAYELTSAGIAVISLKAPQTLDDYAALYHDIARAFLGAKLSDGAKQAEQCVQLANDASAALEKAAEGVSLSEFIYVTEKLTVAGTDTFEGAVLSLCGTNAATLSGYSPVTADIAPEFIVADEKLAEQGFSSDETLAAIARNATVIYVSSTPFERPSARLCGVFSQIKQALSSAQTEDATQGAE